MISIKALFRDGPGPSSMFSMHPYRVAKDFKDSCHDATTIKVTIYGQFKNNYVESLTEQALKNAISPLVSRLLIDETNELPPNSIAAKFQAFGKEKTVLKEETYYFTKLGTEQEINEDNLESVTAQNMLDWTYANGRTIWEYAINFDSPNIEEYVAVKWEIMKKSITKGLDVEGGLPGNFNDNRRASLFMSRSIQNRDFIQQLSKTIAYSLAVVEESACGKTVVAAPTAKSSGILPGVLYSLMETYKISDTRIIRGLLTAGMIGKLLYKDIITGSTYSDISIATAMAGAAATQIMGGSPKQIVAAASMALNDLEFNKNRVLDGHLNYIELNAIGANNSLNNATWALLSDKNISKEIDFFYKTTMKDTYLLI